MSNNVITLADIGARLRQERERLRLNQTDFAALADVTRGSQQNYEGGLRAFPVSYLLALEEHGVNLVYVLTGQRSVEMVSDAEAEVLASLHEVGPDGQQAVLTVLRLMRKPEPPVQPFILPSTEALEDAMLGLLDVEQSYAPAELVREIAMQLPIILEAAAHEIPVPASDQRDTGPGLPEASGAERASAWPGKRT